MRDDELRRMLVDSNPWWRAGATGDPTSWARHHRVLTRRAAHDLGYRSPVLDDIARTPVGDAMVLLVGPRRVGKSVALLDLVVALCRREDMDPRVIIHLPCDGRRARDLRRALTLGRALTASVDDRAPRRRVWVIDEIGSVPEWTATLKAARDQSPVGDDTVIMASSSWSSGPAVTGNLLAGRAGSAGLRRIRPMLPMSFRDYVAATRSGLVVVDPVAPSQLQSSAARAQLDAAFALVDDLDLAWQDYLTCGGFPRAVAEHHRDGLVSADFLQDLMAWLRGDVDADAPPQSTVQLVELLALRSGSPLSVTNAADVLGLSRTALTTRLNRLIHAFAAIACPQRDADARVVPGSQAKVYLSDPLLAWLPRFGNSGVPTPDFTRLSEAALAVALATAIDLGEEGRWVDGDTVGFLRTGSGNEVDLAPVWARTPSGAQRTTPVESKWVDDGWRGEARVIENRFGHGIVATKSILDTSRPVWAVPAPLVALLLQ